MKLSEIENFIAVASAGSMRAAAKQRGITPPALTQCIARLEAELHAPLVVRTTRGAVLSEIGQAFLPRALLIMAEVRRANEEIAQMMGAQSGSVIVGASATPASGILPEAMAQFRRERPAVRVTVVEGLYHRHLPMLRAGTMDFALGPVPSGGFESDIAVEALFENDLAIAARRGGPLSGARSLAELHGAEWIGTGPSTHGPGAAIADAFRSKGLDVPKMMVQCDSISVAQTLLLRTDMVCALPRLMIEREPMCQVITALDIAETLPRYSISLLRRADSPLLPAAQHLATLLQRHAHYASQEAAAMLPR